MMDETQLRNSLAAMHSQSFGWTVVCCRGDRELAEDVLQSVYLSLLEGRLSFQERSTFRTWLYSVIRNVARDRLRGRWWSNVLQLDLVGLLHVVDPLTSADRRISDDEQMFAIRKAIEHLPMRQRQVIHLVYYQGLSLSESAAVMNVSVGTARRHFARAKSHLRNKLGQSNSSPNESIRLETDVRIF